MWYLKLDTHTNKMKHIKQTKRFNRRPIIVALVVVVLLVAAAAAFAYKRHIDSNPTSYDKKPHIDYSPATDEEKADSEQHKEDSTKKEDTPTPTPSGLTSVTPVIVDASQYDNQIEVRAYTSGIFEDGGTCTITFTHGTLKVTKQVAASKDATTTRCTNLDVDRAEFQQPGQWTAIVSYSSSTAQGSSQPRTFEVQ